MRYFAIPYISVVTLQIYNSVYDDETDKQTDIKDTVTDTLATSTDSIYYATNWCYNSHYIIQTLILATC